ncbi:MAG: FliG C-terminal domain-containing protein [Oligoflexales bacterium]
MQKLSGKEFIKFNGLAIALGIIRNLDGSFRDRIMKSLATESPALAKIACECEFLYQDLALLRANSLAQALNNIESGAWLNAWKLTSTELKKIILNHMSERRQTDFLLSAKKSPPIPKHSALKAQNYIAKMILAGLRSGTYNLKKQR